MTSDGAYWAPRLRIMAPSAVNKAIATLRGMKDLSSSSVSTLNLMGSLVAKNIQRETLRSELEATHWNLRQTAERLRMTSAGNVLRAIKDLNLSNEYKAAKARGLAKVGGRRSRVVVEGT